jgi:Cna protein B-type domain./TonB-dependent Receptor Plug Domain.
MKIRFFFLITALLSLSLVAVAQTSRGTVAGTITDPNGAVIPGATVILTNLETAVTRTTTTNDEGFYRFDAVDLGNYSVAVSATSFGAATKTGIEVAANQIADGSTALAPAGQSIVVDVTTDAAALLQTETPVRGGNIDERKITELPFAGRNPVSLALTLPGVSTNRFGFGVGTFSVNGGRGRSNNFLIDGTENNDISVAGQGFQITNPDAVQEVSVQTSNYDAEFGRAGGAVVNVITKSGTNEFHGTLSYLLDSTRDDAITNTQGQVPSTVARGYPPFGIEQWYSATIGGPVLLPRFGEGGKRAIYNGHNRTFFFFSYQEQRLRANSTFNRTVPTQAGRDLLRALFPVGTNPRVDQYLAVTGNVIGTTNVQNIALGVSPGGVARPAIQFGTGSFSIPTKFFDQQIIARIDHKISDKDQFAIRYTWGDQIQPAGADVTFPNFIADFRGTFNNLLLTETHVFSPNVTNEVRLHYNRILFDFPIVGPDLQAFTLPRFDIGGISSFGVATNIPQGRIANNYGLQDTVTWLSGNHTFRFGVDLLSQRSKQFAPIVERGLLTYSASTGYTAFANFVDNFGGGAGAARIDFGSPVYYPFLFRQAYFFQDRWRVTESLTMTLGLRYENFGNPTRTLRTAAFTGLFNINPVTLTGPFSQPNQVESDNNNFAPTFGIAWSPSYTNGFLGRLVGDKKTVFRAGYQIGYDSFFNNIASNAATSSPNVVATNIPSNTNNGPRGLANLSGNLPTVARALTPLDGQTLVTRDLVNPYYQRWSAGFQRTLPFNLVLDASYVGSKGTKLFINEDLNPTVPAPNPTRVIPLVTPTRITPAAFTGSLTCTPGAAGCNISGRLDNLQGSRLIRTNSGTSNYHSGQFSLTRRFANGFTITGAYTWSKFIDNGSEVFGVAGNNLPQQAAFPSIFGGQARERSVSLFDRPHRASITYVYALPFMKEQRGFVGKLLGGFEISGITTFESGTPLTVVNGVDADGVGGNLDRPLFNPNGQKGVRAVPIVNTVTGAITGYLNPDAPGPVGGFAAIDPNTAQYIGLPAFSAALPASAQRFGTTGRNTERTPGINNWNINLLKRIKIGETRALELRTELYNAFNHPQYTIPSVSPFSPGEQGYGASVGSASFNPMTGVTSFVPGTASGRFLDPKFADAGGRVIRYQVKFIF